MFEPLDTIEALASAIDRRFFAPLRRPRTRRVGVELELPVWNLTPGKATDFDAVHDATEEFLARFDFPDTALDDAGALYRARDLKSGDELSFDCSFNTLEQFYLMWNDETVDDRHRKAAKSLFEHYGRLSMCILAKEFNPDMGVERVLTPSFIDTMFTDVNPYLAN